jgi:hypothetical protein
MYGVFAGRTSEKAAPVDSKGRISLEAVMNIVEELSEDSKDKAQQCYDCQSNNEQLYGGIAGGHLGSDDVIFQDTPWRGALQRKMTAFYNNTYSTVP